MSPYTATLKVSTIGIADSGDVVVIPTSREYKAWPEEQRQLLEDTLNMAIPTCVEHKDDIQRAMQSLGYDKSLVDEANKETGYDSRSSIEFMNRRLQVVPAPEQGVKGTKGTIYGSKSTSTYI